MTRGLTTTLYVLMLLCFLFTHMDVGITAGSSTDIAKHFNITETQVGLIASSLSIGNVIGTFIAPSVFGKLRAKHIVLLAVVLNSVSIAGVAFTDNFDLMVISRGLAGLFKVAFTAYFPIFIDMYAPEDLGELWTKISYLAIPMGTVLGYGILIITKEVFAADWHYAFFIQTTLMALPVILIYFIIPKRYFDKFPKKTDKQEGGINCKYLNINLSLVASINDSVSKKEDKTADTLYEPLIKEMKDVVKKLDKEVKFEDSFLYSTKCAFKEDLKTKILAKSYKVKKLKEGAEDA